MTSIVDEAEFDAERWYGVLEAHRVSVWYTAPTAIRMMMKLGADLVCKRDLRALRFLASVGEPLNPETDYPKLSTLSRCVEYVAGRQSRERGGGASPGA